MSEVRPAQRSLNQLGRKSSRRVIQFCIRVHAIRGLELPLQGMGSYSYMLASLLGVSAGLKRSQSSRFRGWPLGLPVVRVHTYTLAATSERQLSRFAN
jgi:hypothetical protein